MFMCYFFNKILRPSVISNGVKKSVFQDLDDVDRDGSWNIGFFLYGWWS